MVGELPEYQESITFPMDFFEKNLKFAGENYKFCCSIYERLPLQFKEDVKMKNKYLAIWISLAFQPVLKCLPFYRAWVYLRHKMTKDYQCQLCLSSYANSFTATAHRMRCPLRVTAFTYKKNKNAIISRLSHALRTKFQNLGGKTYICVFGCLFSSHDLREACKHYIEVHTDKEM